ncbi:MAG: MMPL family transporter [Pseudomonadota bacterium]
MDLRSRREPPAFVEHAEGPRAASAETAGAPRAPASGRGGAAARDDQDDRHGNLVDRAVLGWMLAAMRAPRLALAALALLTAASIYAAASYLGIDTDSSKMLAPDLPFQERAQRLNDAFPQLKNTIVVVVRSASEDAADAVVADVAARLQAGAPGIDSVFAPTADPYLIGHGLLYLETDELESRIDQISLTGRLIAQLRESPTLETFAASFGEALRLSKGAQIDPAALGSALDAATRVIEAGVAGAPTKPFGWSSAFDGAMTAETAQMSDKLGGAGPASEATTRVIGVRPAFDFTALNPAKTALVSVRAAVTELDPRLARLVEAGLVEIGVTGEPALRAEELRSVSDTIALSLAASLALVALLLFIGLGSIRRAALAFVGLMLALAITTAFAAVAIGALNLISIAFIVLMVGLGIDFSIHILAHIDERARRNLTAERAVRETALSSGTALTLSAATTSAAFLAFALTDFQGMAQLGLIGGVGVLIAFAVAMTLIPATLALAPALALTRASRRGGAAAGRARAAGAAEPPRPRQASTALALGAIAVGALALVLAKDARFDADPMGLRANDAPSVTAFNWLAQTERSTPYRMSALFTSEAALLETKARLDALDEVRATVWLADLVPDEQLEKLDLIDLGAAGLDMAVEGTPSDLFGDAEPQTLAELAQAFETDPDLPAARAFGAALQGYLAAQTPETTARIEQDLFQFFPMMIERLRLQREIREVTLETAPETLVARYRAPNGALRLEVLPAEDVTDPAAMRRFFDAVSAVAPQVAGGPAQIVPAADTVGGAMLQAALTAVLATGLLAWLAVRRAWDAVAILAPLTVAGAVTAAVSVAADLPFNYANVIVLPLMIGLGVDSGVHLALRARHAGGGGVFATSTPRAVLFSALTTACAFGTLAFSDHRGTASMGALLVIALLASVAAIFAITPWLVERTGRKAPA